jgi:hypothetical protein
MKPGVYIMEHLISIYIEVLPIMDVTSCHLLAAKNFDVALRFLENLCSHHPSPTGLCKAWFGACYQQ